MYHRGHTPQAEPIQIQPVQPKEQPVFQNLPEENISLDNVTPFEDPKQVIS